MPAQRLSGRENGGRFFHYLGGLHLKALVTGGAGFIGSNLVKALLEKGHEVTVIDNLFLGRESLVDKRAKFMKGDLTDKDFVLKTVKGFDVVFHLAGVSDIREGTKDRGVFMKKNVASTQNVLEAMQLNGVEKIVFSSPSAIYGNAKVKPTPESYGPILPISLYAAAKMSEEGLISAYSDSFGLKAWIYRFANIIGPGLTHGVIYDFVEKLRKNPKELEVLGDGGQKKSYTYVTDCIEGMLAGLEGLKEQVNVANVSADDYTEVREIAEETIKRVSPGAKIKYTGGDRGWVGDVSFTFTSNEKLKGIGWAPRYTSRESVAKTIQAIIEAKN